MIARFNVPFFHQPTNRLVRCLDSFLEFLIVHICKEVCKRSAGGFLSDLYQVSNCLKVVSSSYFDGHGPLFAYFQEAFKQILESARRLAEAYNSCFVVEIERHRGPLKCRDSDTDACNVVDSAI